ncbi:MAG: hypothetical protein IJT94_01680 [Oscillibacter sp.]|nr:hypothetical protein [Oscillibacter sp.]
MSKEEMISQEIDKYTDLLRILEADEDWKAEIRNQIRKSKAKLESLGVSVEPLTIERNDRSAD